VGLEYCYGSGDGPAHRNDGRWLPVGEPGTRPGVPMASGQGVELA
jgi:hypothetical protein